MRESMIGFRVDANEKIATGHLMRCIAIASQCRERGEQCLFLLAEEKETSRLRSREIPYRVLHTQWDDMESEVPLMQEIMKQERMDWLVVDSYQVTAQYLSKLNQIVPVMYIDDMALEPYDVSALLHYGLCLDGEEYQQAYQGRDLKLLMGTGYIPLREEFLLQKEGLPEAEIKREKSILLTTGGTDPYDITGQVLKLCLARQEFAGYLFHVIIGSMNRYEKDLRRLASKYSQIVLHKNVSNMSHYMRHCELAVSAGGTTLFELCACGIPTVCFSFADNQKEGTVGMGKKDVMRYAGDAREDKVPENILKQLLFLQEKEVRLEYAKRMQKLVDGRGTERIADALLASKTV